MSRLSSFELSEDFYREILLMYSQIDNFSDFNLAFDELGVWKEGRLGNARVMIVDSVKCRDTVLKIYSRAKEDLCIEKMELDPSLWR